MADARDTTTHMPDHGPDSERATSAPQGKEALPGTHVSGDPEALREVAEQMRESFLRPVEGAELVLIDVDPMVLHAFWRVPLSLFRAAQTKLGPDDTLAPMFLHIEAVDQDGQNICGAADAFDVRVSGLQSRAYIDVHSTERSYRASLGLRGKDGAFAELGRSNVARLPPLGPQGQEFSEIKHQPVIVPAWPPDEVKGTHSAPAPQQSEALDPLLPPEGSVPQPGEPWPEELVALHPPPETTQLDVQISTDVGEGGTGQSLGPSGSPITHVLEPHQAAMEQAQSNGNGAPAGGPFALDEILPLSSYVFAGSGDEIDLEVTAELHIYGRTKPGRAVQLCGRPVRLRPDGSFSVRRILPNDPQLISALLASTDAPDSEGNG